MSAYVFTLRLIAWAAVACILIVALLAAEFGPLAWCNAVAQDLACGEIQ